MTLGVTSAARVFEAESDRRRKTTHLSRKRYMVRHSTVCYYATVMQLFLPPLARDFDFVVFELLTPIVVTVATPATSSVFTSSLENALRNLTPQIASISIREPYLEYSCYIIPHASDSQANGLAARTLTMQQPPSNRCSRTKSMAVSPPIARHQAAVRPVKACLGFRSLGSYGSADLSNIRIPTRSQECRWMSTCCQQLSILLLPLVPSMRCQMMR